MMKVGQGTFGEVFKACDRRTRRIVALKRIVLENQTEGFPITALREIKILKWIDHENIVKLIEVCSETSIRRNGHPRTNFYLVLEFCEHDLSDLIASIRFTLPEIKEIMKMLFNALYFIHISKIIHRDLKPANILMTKSGVLKLADFGLARAIHAGNEHK
jgi:cyclin-dependent kinase 9